MKKNLILEFCTDSTNEELTKPIYSYDAKRSLNVVEFNGKFIPFIDSQKEIIELITKTGVAGESADYNDLLELGTKTEVRRESDDYTLCLGELELNTKTFVNREGDQLDFSNSLFDTITKVAREDNDFHNESLN